MQQTEQTRVLSKREAARFLGLSEQQLAWLVRRRAVPFTKPAGTRLIRFLLADLDAWLRAGRQEQRTR